MGYTWHENIFVGVGVHSFFTFADLKKCQKMELPRKKIQVFTIAGKP